MIGIQTYQEIVHETWMLYAEQRTEESWFTSDEVHVVENLRQLKRQSIEQVLGQDLVPPKAVAFDRLKNPGFYVPGVIVAKANTVFDYELKKEALSLAGYALTNFKLNYSGSKNSRKYLMLTIRGHRKDSVSASEKEKLRDFTKTCIDFAILFTDPEFKQVSEEFSQFPRQIAERYVKDLNLQGDKKCQKKDQ